MVLNPLLFSIYLNINWRVCGLGIMLIGRKCTTEFFSCANFINLNTPLSSKASKSTATTGGLCMQRAFKFLDAVLQRGLKNIPDFINYPAFWLDTVENTDQIIADLSTKFGEVYDILCVYIPIEVTLLWCITTENRGVPELFRLCVANTSLISYLVGDDIYSNLKSLEIGHTLKLVQSVRNCHELTRNMAIAVRSYFKKTSTIPRTVQYTEKGYALRNF